MRSPAACGRRDLAPGDGEEYDSWSAACSTVPMACRLVTGWHEGLDLRFGHIGRDRLARLADLPRVLSLACRRVRRWQGPTIAPASSRSSSSIVSPLRMASSLRPVSNCTAVVKLAA